MPQFYTILTKYEAFNARPSPKQRSKITRYFEDRGWQVYWDWLKYDDVCLAADPSESVTVGTQELRDDLKRILLKYVLVFNGKAFSGWTNPSGLPWLGTKWDGPATAPTTSPR